jgi:hypothetical protein
MLKHEPQQAALSYEASLGINSGDIDARKKLIFVLEKLDKQKVERESEKLKYISSFYSKF